jgi:hypothetical protein
MTWGANSLCLFLRLRGRVSLPWLLCYLLLYSPAPSTEKPGSLLWTSADTSLRSTLCFLPRIRPHDWCSGIQGPVLGSDSLVQPNLESSIHNRSTKSYTLDEFLVWPWRWRAWGGANATPEIHVLCLREHELGSSKCFLMLVSPLRYCFLYLLNQLIPTNVENFDVNNS